MAIKCREKSLQKARILMAYSCSKNEPPLQQKVQRSNYLQKTKPPKKKPKRSKKHSHPPSKTPPISPSGGGGGGPNNNLALLLLLLALLLFLVVFDIAFTEANTTKITSGLFTTAEGTVFGTVVALFIKEIKTKL